MIQLDCFIGRSSKLFMYSIPLFNQLRANDPPNGHEAAIRHQSSQKSTTNIYSTVYRVISHFKSHVLLILYFFLFSSSNLSPQSRIDRIDDWIFAPTASSMIIRSQFPHKSASIASGWNKFGQCDSGGDVVDGIEGLVDVQIGRLDSGIEGGGVDLGADLNVVDSSRLSAHRPLW